MKRTIQIESKSDLKNRLNSFLDSSEDWAFLSFAGFTYTLSYINVGNVENFFESLRFKPHNSTYMNIDLSFYIHESSPIEALIFILSVYCLLMFLFMYVKERFPLTISIEDEVEDE